MRTILELNLKECHDFQRWIIDDWVQDNGFVEVFYTSYNQRLAVDKEDTMELLMAIQEDTMKYLLKKLEKETIIKLINQEITKDGFLFALESGVFVE